MRGNLFAFEGDRFSLLECAKNWPLRNANFLHIIYVYFSFVMFEEGVCNAGDAVIEGVCK